MNAIDKNDSSRMHLKEDILRLKRRARLLNNGIIFLTISAIVTALLVIVAFVSAFYDLPLRNAFLELSKNCEKLAIQLEDLSPNIPKAKPLGRASGVPR